MERVIKKKKNISTVSRDRLRTPLNEIKTVI